MAPVPAPDAGGEDGTRRRAVLDVLRTAAAPLDVVAVARAVGLSTSTARFHLDHLSADGLVETETQRPSGAGRPRKLYRALPTPAVDTAAAMRRLAVLLADGLGPDGGQAAIEAGRAWAGRVLTERLASGLESAVGNGDRGRRALLALATDVLAEEGFAPHLHADETSLELRACPFLSVAAEHAAVVCGLHLGLLQGLAEGMGVDAQWKLVPELDGDGPCLVHLRQRPSGE